MTEVWDVVRVPFPYTDRPVRQFRPALVVASPTTAGRPALLWVLMITSAVNRGWPGDVEIADHAAAGLPVASVIRTEKIATIEARDAEPVGQLPQSAQTATIEQVWQHLSKLGALPQTPPGQPPGGPHLK